MQSLCRFSRQETKKRKMAQILKILNIDLAPLDKDVEGNTVLHHVIKNEHLMEKEIAETLQIFMDSGINPNTANSQGETVLHLAVAKRIKSVISILIKYKASINVDQRLYITHYLIDDEYMKFWQEADDSQRENMESESAAFIEWLISKGFDFHSKDERGSSALRYAADKLLLHIFPTVLKYTKDVKFLECEGKHLFRSTANLGTCGTLHSEDLLNFSMDWFRDYRLRHATSIAKVLLDAAQPTNEVGIELLDIALSSGDTSIVAVVTNYCPNGVKSYSSPKNSYASTMFRHIMRSASLYKWTQKDLSIITNLIARGVDVNGEDEHGRTPLYWALKAKKLDAIEVLIKHGAFFSADGWDVMHAIAAVAEFCPTQVDDEEIKKRLLDFMIDKGYRMDVLNGAGDTPLHVAAKCGNLTFLKVLASGGADFNVVNTSGQNLLHILAAKDVVQAKCVEIDEKLFNLVVSEGCRLSTKNRHGETPLYVAAKCGNLSIARKLVGCGAEVDCKTEYDEQSPLHCAVMYPELAQFLLNAGAAVNCRDAKGRTPLHYAPSSGEAVGLLFRGGADLEALDNEGDPALHGDDRRIIERLVKRIPEGCGKTSCATALLNYALASPVKNRTKRPEFPEWYVNILPELLAKSADLNYRDKYQRTPLYWAVVARNLRAVELFKKLGADFSVITEYGRNLLHVLAKRKFDKVGCEEVGEALFDVLVSEGCQVNARNVRGETPLHMAAGNGNWTIVRKLIRHGAEVNSKSNILRTPLHCAVLNGHIPRIVEFLIKAGADVNSRDARGRTPLHFAASAPRETSDASMVSLLLEGGAYLDPRDDSGKSAFARAIRYNNVDNAKKLLEHRANWSGTYNEDDFRKAPSGELYNLVLQHWIKLSAANLPLLQGYEAFSGLEQFYTECLREVDVLKVTFIDSFTSLYQLLHMHPNSRCIHVNNEKLKDMVDSPKFREQFPKYSALVLTIYHQAVYRQNLLKLAKEVWMELTRICLPDICIERIYAFLSNEDLATIVEEN